MSKFFIVPLLVFLLSCASEDDNEQPLLPEAPTMELVLKTSNGKYVSINSAGYLVADASSSEAAAAFDIIELNDGKKALLSSNGKFVCADREVSDILIANRNQPGLWESFTIDSQNYSKISIKAFNNKFVCADQSAANVLVANRDSLGDWETFKIERIKTE